MVTGIWGDDGRLESNVPNVTTFICPGIVLSPVSSRTMMFRVKQASRSGFPAVSKITGSNIGLGIVGVAVWSQVRWELGQEMSQRSV
jgi:hypothetical protein